MKKHNKIYNIGDWIIYAKSLKQALKTLKKNNIKLVILRCGYYPENCVNCQECYYYERDFKKTLNYCGKASKFARENKLNVKLISFRSGKMEIIK